VNVDGFGSGFSFVPSLPDLIDASEYFDVRLDVDVRTWVFHLIC